MRQVKYLYPDDRQLGGCLYCAAHPETLTRDHAPSRVFLDEPYPTNLPVIMACEACNRGFSSDEQYVSALIEVARVGSTEPCDVERPKIRRLLQAKPEFAATLGAAAHVVEGQITWRVDRDRVSRIARKLATSHIAFECGVKNSLVDACVSFAPLCAMTAQQIAAFDASPGDAGDSAVQNWPEIGSRVLDDVVRAWPSRPEQGTSALDWVTVQRNRYRYAVSADGRICRLVLSEYLACEVLW